MTTNGFAFAEENGGGRVSATEPFTRSLNRHLFWQMVVRRGFGACAKTSEINVARSG